MPGWKPSCMPPECFQAKPSCEPGAFNSCGSTGPISIVPGYPRERSRLISRAQSEKSLCTCKNLVGARFENPCDVPFRSSGICIGFKVLTGDFDDPASPRFRCEDLNARFVGMKIGALRLDANRFTHHRTSDDRIDR